MVECLLQVDKAHVDWLGKLPCTLKDPAEGVELVQCSTAWMKTTFLLLNPRFDYPTDPPLQHPRIDLTRKAEECDPPIVGTHPPVPLLKKRDHHPSLPIQRHCPPRLPRYMIKALPEVGVEALSDRRLYETFPADPRNTYWSARSDRHPPPPSQPTHHQVVISWQLRPSLRPSVQDMRPQVWRHDYKVNHRTVA